MLEDRVEPLARHDIGDHIARRNEVNFVRLPAWATAQAADAVGVAVLQQLLIERDVQSGPQGVEQRISAAPWNAAHSQFGPAGVGSCARIIAIRKIDPSQVGIPHEVIIGCEVGTIPFSRRAAGSRTLSSWWPVDRPIVLLRSAFHPNHTYHRELRLHQA